MEVRQSLWAILAGAFLVPAFAVAQQSERYEFAQAHMGVPIRIVLYTPDEQTANKAAAAAFARIDQLDQIMSDYKPDSELIRLCRSSGPGTPMKVSRELQHVLRRSQVLSCRSDGAFDVTVGPIVRLWRRARRRKQLPDPDRLRQARALVGFRLVRLDPCNDTVELLKSGMRLDLGGIAKGYAADEALAVLRKQGLSSVLIDAGGDIVVGDPPPDKPGWRIAIASPPFLQTEPAATGHDNDRVPERILVLKNAAVATSGDTYQYVQINGTRYSHIVDPRTGIALTHPSSVTVIAPDGLTADSLASAVSVLGPDNGLDLIEATNGTATLILQRDDAGRPQVYQSKRLARYLLD